MNFLKTITYKKKKKKSKRKPVSLVKKKTQQEKKPIYPRHYLKACRLHWILINNFNDHVYPIINKLFLVRWCLDLFCHHKMWIKTIDYRKRTVFCLVIMATGSLWTVSLSLSMLLNAIHTPISVPELVFVFLKLEI